ncbi:MAG: DUF2062 domain-containing protein [Pseudomonadota bacterium]
MIFKRRNKPSLLYRVREFFAPRKGFLRGMDYIGKRMRRLPDSPHRIALGFACGALASFTPFFGFHFFVAAGLAWLIRANIVASLFGTIVGNPLTFPLISGLSLWLGRRILGRDGSGSDFDAITDAFGEAFSSIWAEMQSWFGYGPSMVDGLLSFLNDVFLPYLVGGFGPGMFCALLCYFGLGPLIDAYQRRRRAKLERIQAKHKARIEEELDAYAASDGREGDRV